MLGRRFVHCSPVHLAFVPTERNLHVHCIVAWTSGPYALELFELSASATPILFSITDRHWRASHQSFLHISPAPRWLALSNPLAPRARPSSLHRLACLGERAPPEQPPF